MQKYIYITITLFLGLAPIAFAQDKDKGKEEKDLGTETVTVVKAYKPTIADAFKLKSTPVINGAVELKKKPINYSIFSVPVASTFTPAKGKATAVKKKKPEELFNSYASLGLGNYNNALVDFYTSRPINRNETLDVGLNHHSSRGDIEEAPVDNVFYDTKVKGIYTRRERDLEWNANLALQHKLYSWYGVTEDALGTIPESLIDEKQHYFDAELGGELKMEDYLIKGGDVLLRRFWDATESGENRAVINAAVEVPISNELINFNVKLDYLGGKFKNASLNNTDNTGEIKFGQVQFGVNPSLVILRDDLTLNLGANIVYGLDTEASDSNLYIYPAVTASYRLSGETAIAYGGIEGDLHQNSYHDFVDENPFVSPTLTILPTDSQYNAYAGLKGQLLTNLGYNVKASYTAENNRALYKLNPENAFRADEDKDYHLGNTFDIFYDDIKTFSFFGELNVDVNRNFALGINAEVFSYTTETDNPAWNLPKVKGSLFLDYQINEKWFMGANLFFVGEREDLGSVAATGTQPQDFVSTVVTLDSYFDANAHVGYRLDEKLSLFIKTANIANNNYQRWANYPVQGFQVLAGATYKFNW
ncbi:MAG: TonB-dependent receptor [Cellulophaga sp.]